MSNIKCNIIIFFVILIMVNRSASTLSSAHTGSTIPIYILAGRGLVLLDPTSHSLRDLLFQAIGPGT